MPFFVFFYIIQVMKIQAFSIAGKKAQNEDYFGVYQKGRKLIIPSSWIHTRHAKDHVGLFVADGVSTSNAPLRAARFTCQQLADWQGQDIQKTLQAMDQTIKKRMNGSMCTVSGGYIEKKRLTYFNVGDSPIFLFRDHTLMLLSKPHILEGYPHVITSCMGYLTAYYAHSLSIQARDQLVFGSDGVLESLSVDELAHALDQNTSIEQIFQMALHAGSQDNMTLIRVQI